MADSGKPTLKVREFALYELERIAKKYRFTLGEELAHLLIHTSIFAICKTIEDPIAIEDALNEIRKDRLENNARALAPAF